MPNRLIPSFGSCSVQQGQERPAEKQRSNTVDLKSLQHRLGGDRLQIPIGRYHASIIDQQVQPLGTNYIFNLRTKKSFGQSRFLIMELK